MDATHADSFWSRTPPRARPALIAALVELVVGLLVFVAGAIAASIYFGDSPWTVVFGPVPGRPVIVWLYFVIPLVIVQGAVGLALRHQSRPLRMAGTLGAFVFAGVALRWVALALYDLLDAFLGETDRYIETGGLVTLPFVPLALVLGILDARAGLSGLRDVRRSGGTALATA